MTLHTPLQTPLSRTPPMFLAKAPLGDSEADMTDAWNDRNDPDNEEGAIVTGIFAHEFDGEIWMATLIALSVEIRGLPLHYSPSGALLMLGNRSVHEAEQAQGERI